MLDAFRLSVPVTTIATVYLAFRLKHLLADYVLQTSGLARGKARANGWLAPLLTHAAIHALGTLLIATLIAPRLWWLGAVDLVVHALIDRLKALPAIGGRWAPHEAAFWWAHGIDQEAHNLTHFAFVLAIALAA